jgi:hypothetical protein
MAHPFGAHGHAWDLAEDPSVPHQLRLVVVPKHLFEDATRDLPYGEFELRGDLLPR